jgi:hypothetical protein
MAEQLGNTVTRGVPAVPTLEVNTDPTDAPVVVDATPDGAPMVRQIDTQVLRNLGAKYKALFDRFASERMPAEQRWLRNMRQYLGIYDPDIERMLPANRSRAYPRLTRVKCVSMLSRLMNLMFPGNEDNWELNASPSPSMSPDMVAQAVQEMISIRKESGQSTELTQDLIDSAIRHLADKQAAAITVIVKDQLLELGGDQTRDWVGLNRKVCDSGIKFGIGVLEGPYVRKIEQSGWMLKAPDGPPGPDGRPTGGGFQPTTRVIYKPQFENLSVWDFYPDMSARTPPGEGYFVRKVLGRSALRKLASRKDFFERQIKEVLVQLPGGNFKAKSWETELKAMGTAINTEQTSAQSSGREKYEIVIWKGPVSAQTLREAGSEVPDEMLADDVEAELWMIENWVIKAEVNAWRKLGIDMQTVHIFNFDEDDTSPIGNGLPSIVRDSQLSICAAVRMSLDNASVTCGPNLEVNTALMRQDQDLTSVQPYKIWYRDDDGPSSQFPAVRRIEIDGHLAELQSLVKMFMEFGEMETFIGGATGGDMAHMPSEPMRTAAGASALRGDAALPFKDIVRNFDGFTQSVIWSIVNFNKKFNPDLAPEGDYDVIPRGATSLIAKEVRGMQIDQLSQTMTDTERDHVDERKFIEAKFASRDLQGMLVSPEVVAARQNSKAQMAQEQQDKQDKMLEANIRKILADALKGVSQAQKNSAATDKTSVETATTMMENQDGSVPSGARSRAARKPAGGGTPA